MIPIKLQIKGLYSYQEEQLIDFRRLMAGNIFGIFGKVGSGKSSILEAITFALYGDTERMNNRDQRNYNMMNLRSKELYIRLEFENHAGRYFSAVVSAKRHGKKFDMVATYERKFYELKDGAWLPLELQSAQSLIGLSYDNFKRTIIIPQGRFQEFLELTSKDRTGMLKEIFQLQRYDLFGKAARLESEAKESLHKLEGRLSQFESITLESLELTKVKFEETKQSWKTSHEEWKRVKAEVSEQEKWKADFDARSKDLAQLETLENQESEFDQIRMLVAKLEVYQSKFQSSLKALEVYEEICEKLEKACKQYKESVAIKEQQLQVLSPIFEEIKIKYKDLDRDKTYLKQLKCAASLATLLKEQEIEAERLRNGAPIIQQKEEEQIQKRSDITALKLLVKKGEAYIEQHKDLKEVLLWMNRRAELEQEIQQSQKKIKSIQQEQVELLSVCKLAGDYVESGQNPPFGTLRDALDLEVLKRKLQDLQAEEKSLVVHAKLGEFAAALQEGDACPLCGSTQHPYIYHSETHSDALKKCTESIAACESEIENKRLQIRQIDQWERKWEEWRKQSEEWHHTASEWRKKLEKHQKDFIWTAYKDKDADALSTLAAELEQQQILLKKKKEALENEEKNAVIIEQELSKFNTGLDKIKTKLATFKGRISELYDQLGADFIMPEEGFHYPSEIDALEKKIFQVSKDYEEKGEALQKIQNKRNEEKAALDSSEVQLKDQKDKWDTTLGQLNMALLQSDFDNLEEVRNLSKRTEEIQNDKVRLEKYEREVDAIKKRIAEYDEKQGERTFDAEAFGQLKQRAYDLEHTASQLQKREIEQAAYLKRLEEEWEEKQALLKKRESLEIRLANIRQLKVLFQANGFVNYISSVYLQNLCEAANERFYVLTKQQLRLEVDDNNEFKVRDYLNDGHLRSAKTLSGGQTFKASLCLALALAESVQAQSKAPQNFFFLDEGFGSLDKDTLRSVFDTLKSLRDEKRIVGIISHVEELQQEIDQYLHINNDAERGSLIKSSWDLM